MLGTVHFALSLASATAVSVEPVSLTEAKAHVRETATGQDVLLLSLIAAAREDGEERTARGWVRRAYNLKLDRFPCGGEPILLPKPPLLSVTAITYVDSDGVTQTWSSSEYTVDTASEPGRIVPAFGYVWPSTRDVPGAVTVRFLSGYGATAASVPQRLRQACLLTIGSWYENRENEAIGTIVSPIPNAADAIYKQMRVYRFG